MRFVCFIHRSTPDTQYLRRHSGRYSFAVPTPFDWLLLVPLTSDPLTIGSAAEYMAPMNE